MYDPVLGRMLSPDNFVQDATSVRGYNRYAYVYNNPLKYVDESGEFFGVDDAIVMGVGFLLGAGVYAITHIGQKWDAKTWGMMVVTGLATAAIAEVGYLTLGGGLVATSGSGATAASGLGVGGFGSMQSAGGFAFSFSTSFAGNVYNNYHQIKDAFQQGEGLSGVGLVVAYAGVSSVVAGLGNNTWLKNADFLGKGINETEVFSNAANRV
jgi:hypothetical protein